MLYDFSTLNDKEFEELARDILNAQWGLDLQSFKKGKDQGRDCRYSTTGNRNSIVVQAKHYIRSGFALLKSDLEKSELPKIKLLKPDRYILVTSLPLSALDKDKLVEVLAPFVLTANDVLGSEDLNKYIGELPRLEERWHKLWLTSTVVLKRILHNAVYGRSAFIESEIRRSVGLYVPNDNFEAAYSILSEHRYLLITGQPGVGKTTLANYLTFHLLAQGYQLVYIDSDIKDGEQVFNDDPNSKQLFYFDDFLGSSYLETLHPRTSESSFVKFLDRVKATPGKRLILTTRTLIYKTALEKYEKLRRTNVDMARKEIALGQYDNLDRARILYNHLYHSNLPSGCLEELVKKKGYWSVIRHRNYNPRLVEFICKAYNFQTSGIPRFSSFVKETFDNPKEVWLHAYEHQLTVEERLLWHAVFIGQTGIEVSRCKEMFDLFLHHEITHYQYRPSSNPFHNACKKLLDGILVKEVDISGKKDEPSEEKFRFENPSIRDFLIYYLTEHPEERWKLIEGSLFIEQLEHYDTIFSDVLGPDLDPNDEGIRFCRYILDHFKEIRTYERLDDKMNRHRYCALRTSALLQEYKLLLEHEAIEPEIDALSYQTISEYDPNELIEDAWEYYYKHIQFAKRGSPIYQFVQQHWDRIILNLYRVAGNEGHFDHVYALFDEYDQDYELFLDRNDHGKMLAALLKEIADEQTLNWINGKRGQVVTKQEWDQLKKEVKATRKKMFEDYDLADDKYDEADFFEEGEALARLLRKNKSLEKDRLLKLDSSPVKSQPSTAHHTRLINQLFQ